MNNVKVFENEVVIPRLNFYEFSFNGYSMTIFADSLDSASDLVEDYLGSSPESIYQVDVPLTHFSLLCIDFNFKSIHSVSLARVPLNSTFFYQDIVDYFRFNVSDSVKVVFE